MGTRRKTRGPRVTSDSHHHRLRRRAHRHARKGDLRSAIKALRQLTNLDDEIEALAGYMQGLQ